MKDAKDIGALRPRVLGLDWSGLVVKIEVDDNTIMINDAKEDTRQVMTSTLRIVDRPYGHRANHVIRIASYVCSQNRINVDEVYSVNGSQMLVENEQVTKWSALLTHTESSPSKKRDSIEPRDVYILQMRAGLNRQRHAVYYEVDLTETWSKAVIGCIERGDYIFALKDIQDSRCAPIYGVSALGCNEAELHNSWELIPDPALDPWHGSGESGWVPPLGLRTEKRSRNPWYDRGGITAYTAIEQNKGIK